MKASKQRIENKLEVDKGDGSDISSLATYAGSQLDIHFNCQEIVLCCIIIASSILRYGLFFSWPTMMSFDAGIKKNPESGYVIIKYFYFLIL